MLNISLYELGKLWAKTHSMHLSIPSPGLSTMWVSLCFHNKRLSQETWSKTSNVNAISILLSEWLVSKDIFKKAMKNEQKVQIKL